MKYHWAFPRVFAALAVLGATQADADDQGKHDVHRLLADALVCKGEPAEAVYGLVERGSDFAAGYAAHGFGEGTSYRAVVVLREPLQLAGAKAMAVVSETENSNSDFLGFTYALFEGDPLKAIQALKLQAAKPFTDTSLGRFVSREPPASECPPTIALTPVDETHFLLGCGWCNGG